MVLAAIARAMLVPIVALTAFAVLPFEGRVWPLTVVAGVLAGFASLPMAARHVSRIAASDFPMAEAMAAVSTVVTMVLVGFASGYYALALHTEQISGLETKVDAVYFTVVTLGTVGFGDIVPVGQAARALVALQIVLNLSVIALSIRWIAKAAAERRGAVDDA